MPIPLCRFLPFPQLPFLKRYTSIIWTCGHAKSAKPSQEPKGVMRPRFGCKREAWVLLLGPPHQRDKERPLFVTLSSTTTCTKSPPSPLSHPHSKEREFRIKSGTTGAQLVHNWLSRMQTSCMLTWGHADHSLTYCLLTHSHCVSVRGTLYPQHAREGARCVQSVLEITARQGLLLPEGGSLHCSTAQMSQRHNMMHHVSE